MEKVKIEQVKITNNEPKQVVKSASMKVLFPTTNSGYTMGGTDKPNFLHLDRMEWVNAHLKPVEFNSTITYMSDSTAQISININDVKAVWPEVRAIDMISADYLIDKDNMVGHWIVGVQASKTSYTYTLDIDEWFTYASSIKFRENVVPVEGNQKPVCTWKPGQENKQYCEQPRGYSQVLSNINIIAIMVWQPDLEANMANWHSWGTTNGQIGITAYDNHHGYTHYKALPPREGDIKTYYVIGHIDMPGGIAFDDVSQGLFNNTNWYEQWVGGEWVDQSNKYTKKLLIDVARGHSNNQNLWVNTQQNAFGSPEAAQSKSAIQTSVERVELKRYWGDVLLSNKWILDYINWTYISKDGYDDFTYRLDQDGVSATGAVSGATFDFTDLRIRQINKEQITHGTHMWWVLMQYPKHNILDEDTGNVMGNVKILLNGVDESYEAKGKQVMHGAKLGDVISSTSIMFAITRIDKTYDPLTSSTTFNIICPDLKSTKSKIPDYNFWKGRGAFIGNTLHPTLINGLIKINLSDELYYNVSDEQFQQGQAYRYAEIVFPDQPDMQYIEKYDIDYIKAFNHYKYDLTNTPWPNMKGEERILWSSDFTNMSITSSYENEVSFPFMRFEEIDFYKIVDFYNSSMVQSKGGAVDLIIPANPKYDNYSYHIETLKKWQKTNKMKDFLLTSSSVYSKELYDSATLAQIELTQGSSGLIDTAQQLATRRPMTESTMFNKQWNYFARIAELYDQDGETIKGSDKEILKSGNLKLWLVLSRVKNIDEHKIDFRKNGVPISGTLAMNRNLHERKYWNYLQVDGDILESVIDLQGSQTVKNYFTELFAKGIRLWNTIEVWKDYDLELDNAYIPSDDFIPENKK